MTQRSKITKHDRSLRRVIIKCLEPNPNDRFASALAVANALAAVEQCLDWRPVQDPVKKVWVKLDGNTEKRFAVNHDGSTEFTSTAPGGAPRRKRDLCVQFMTSTAIKRTLREN